MSLLFLIAKYEDSNNKTVQKTRQCVYFLRLKSPSHNVQCLKIFN